MSLKDYIRGQRHGKEANQLEREAMNDPFLQDAIDGYDSVKGDHLSVIEDLEKRFSSAKKRNDKRTWIWAAVAAVIILLIGIPLLLQLPEAGEDSIIVSSEKTHHENETTLLQEDTILVADHLALDKKKSPTPTIKQTSPPSPTRQSSPKETVIASSERMQQDDIPLSENQGDTNIKTNDDLEEVAVVVSGKQKKMNIVGSVTSVSPSQLTISETNLKETLAGRVEGVHVSVQNQDQLSVSGRIVDEVGEPLIGATVRLKDGKIGIGTTTDIDGIFQLTVPKDAEGTLIASYLGMEESSIPLKENMGDIIMKENNQLLSEVVVVGFGRQKKQTYTGSALKIEKSTDRVHSVNSRYSRDSLSGAKDRAIFGEEEFKQYFNDHYDKDICAGEEIIMVVDFCIDPTGRPSQIKIKENSCPELENEIKRLLLGSPLWSKANREVSLRIELP